MAELGGYFSRRCSGRRRRPWPSTPEDERRGERCAPGGGGAGDGRRPWRSWRGPKGGAGDGFFRRDLTATVVVRRPARGSRKEREVGRGDG